MPVCRLHPPVWFDSDLHVKASLELHRIWSHRKKRHICTLSSCHRVKTACHKARRSCNKSQACEFQLDTGFLRAWWEKSSSFSIHSMALQTPPAVFKKPFTPLCLLSEKTSTLMSERSTSLKRVRDLHKYDDEPQNSQYSREHQTSIVPLIVPCLLPSES